MDHGAKGLAQHSGQAAVNNAWNSLMFLRQATAHHALVERQGRRARGVKGHQRIQTEHQVNTFVHRHARMHGFFQGTVDKVLVVNFYGREKTGQGGTGLYRFGDRHMVPAGLPERCSVAAVKVGGNQREPGTKLPEVVGATRLGEQFSQACVNLIVREDARWQQRPQCFSCIKQGFTPQRSAPQGSCCQPRQHDGPP